MIIYTVEPLSIKDIHIKNTSLRTPLLVPIQCLLYYSTSVIRKPPHYGQLLRFPQVRDFTVNCTLHTHWEIHKYNPGICHTHSKFLELTYKVVLIGYYSHIHFLPCLTTSPARLLIISWRVSSVVIILWNPVNASDKFIL